jgi:hypothetical protein
MAQAEIPPAASSVNSPAGGAGGAWPGRPQQVRRDVSRSSPQTKGSAAAMRRSLTVGGDRLPSQHTALSSGRRPQASASPRTIWAKGPAGGSTTPFPQQVTRPFWRTPQKW